METLFISDLHLDDSRPQITQLFEQFLHTRCARADALYILGDLFEYWVGDDCDSDLARRVAAGLSSLDQHHVPRFFIHGNRDFLLGTGFAKACGMQLLSDSEIVNLYGTSTLLLHGDTLCTDDLAYQDFRRLVRSDKWQSDFLAKPLSERLAFAENARAQSQQHTQNVSEQITDVNANAVIECLQTHNITRIIHGHTHRPAIHSVDLGASTAQRIVTGDWYEQGSVLSVTSEGICLEQLAL